MKHFRILSVLIMCAMWIMSNNTKAAGNDDRLTPERLWSMGRIGSVVSSPDGKSVVYTLTKYDIKENKGHIEFLSDTMSFQSRKNIHMLSRVIIIFHMNINPRQCIMRFVYFL